MNDPLAEARKKAQADAKTAAPALRLPEDLDATECLVQLLVQSYAMGLNYGMGAMRDGSALWLRVRVPRAAKDPHAGMVAFVVDTDPTTMLRKALAALEASPSSNWWKPDQYAQD